VQKFYGYWIPEMNMLSQIDISETTAAQQAHQPLVAYLLTTAIRYGITLFLKDVAYKN